MPAGALSANPTHSYNYRPDIDGLRAVAVLLVVFFHAGFVAVSGGFVGVDIFFVISGYLITGIIVRELDRGHFTFADFYARRIKRICPALFAVLALCAAAGCLLLIPADLRGLGSSISSAVFFYSNWHFYTHVGYFDGPAIEKPLLHTWSLAIEEQFYLIWPISIYAFFRGFGRKALPYIILALLCASLAASQLALGQEPARAFYLLPCRAWELLLGAFLAVTPLSISSRAAANGLGLAGFAAIAYAAAAFDTATPFPGLNAIFPCIGAALLILAGQEQALSRRLLGAAPFRFVGKISYSLYLIHWPLFSFAHIVLNRALTLNERLGIVAASVAMAALSFRYVESPARRAALGFPALLRAAGSVAGALILCGIVFHATNGLPVRAPQGVQEAFAAHDRGGLDRTDCRGDDPRPAIGTRPCPIGAPATGMQYDFLIWGDSHARHMASVFTDQARTRGLAGVVLWVEGCPPFVAAERVPTKCKEANTKVAQWLKKQTKLKIVFLAGRWSHYAALGILRPPESINSGQSEDESHHGLAGTLEFLHSLGMQYAIVDNVPVFPFDITYCAARARMFGRPDERCFVFSRRDIESSTQSSAMLHQMSVRYNAPLIETAGVFCEGDSCRAERDGVFFYIDSNHLSTAGARYLGSRITIPWPQGGIFDQRGSCVEGSEPALITCLAAFQQLLYP